MSLRHSMYCPCCDMTPGAASRRRFLALAGQSAAALALFPHLAYADNDVPSIAYDSVPDPVRLPRDVYFGECSGVALNSAGHIFVLSRGNSIGPAYGAAAAQLLEFDRNGRFVREIGHNLYAWSFAHTVKVDRQDNVWVTDKGSDMIIKFTPEGRVAMVFGRKQEASDEETAPLKHPNPPLPSEPGRFRQVTDVAWDAVGQHVYQRRIHQLARREGRQRRQLAQVVGRARQGAGAVPYAAQHCRRCRTAWSMSPIAATGAFRCSTAKAIFSGNSRSTCPCRPMRARLSATCPTKPRSRPARLRRGRRGRSAFRRDRIKCCIPPMRFRAGSTSYRSTANCSACSAESGKQLKQFGWIHEMACPAENTLFVAELLNWRVQKLVLHG